MQLRQYAMRSVIWLLIASALMWVIVHSNSVPTVLPYAFFMVGALYWLRQYLRISYGLIELAVGAFGLWDGIVRQVGRGPFSDAFAKQDYRLIILETLTPIYIMIRAWTISTLVGVIAMGDLC